MRFSTLLFTACAAFALGACGGSEPDKPTLGGGSVEGTAYSEMAKGSADAPAVLVEYASTTCGHCATMNETVIKNLQPRIDAGELRVEFREFLTPPQSIALAGFQIARCAGEDKYFDVLDDLFENQRGILMASQRGAAKDALIAVGKRHGLSQSEFEVCIRDQQLFDAIQGIMDDGIARGVNSTPTLFMNGEEVPRQEYSLDGITALIDEANGIEPSAVVDGTPEDDAALIGQTTLPEETETTDASEPETEETEPETAEE